MSQLSEIAMWSVYISSVVVTEPPYIALMIFIRIPASAAAVADPMCKL